MHDDTESLDKGAVSITFIGVSTLLFDDGETQLLVDAFFTRPPPIGYLTAMESDREVVKGFVNEFGMDRVDAIVVAHSHVDHAIDVASIADLTDATVYGTESTLNIGRGGGLPEEQLVLVADGDTSDVGGFAVTFLQSPHSRIPGIAAPDNPPTIDEPLDQPATRAEFAEGGNFDFVITHGDRTFVVKASANLEQGTLEGIDADVFLLGTATLGLQDDAFQRRYIEETIGTTTPEIVVPIHWDDFLRPWRRGAAVLNNRLVDRETVAGLDLVIDESEDASAEFVLLQAGSTLRIES